MGDDYPVACGKACDLFHRYTEVLELLGCASDLALSHERVAAERYEERLPGSGPMWCPNPPSKIVQILVGPDIQG